MMADKKKKKKKCASNSEFIANLLIRIAIWKVLNLIRRAAHDGYWVPTWIVAGFEMFATYETNIDFTLW